jgi:hypothetical protein
VTPQADRADVVVRYELPDWEAPDSEVITTITLRREPAKTARSHRLAEDFAGVRQQASGEDVVLRLDTSISPGEVESWGRELFPDTYQPEIAGRYMDETGEPRSRPTLALVEILIARLAKLMREKEPASEAA